MTFAAQTGITLARIAVSFYAFWLIWRVLLPLLPGPRDRPDRIAPFACYFTDPLTRPLARATRIPDRIVAVILLIGLAAADVALNRASNAV